MIECKIEGCSKEVAVSARQMCKGHYSIWSNKHKPNGKKPCAVEGCEKHMYALNLCRTHYETQRRTGSPVKPPKVITNCVDCEENPAAVSSRCRRCYSRWWYHNRAVTGTMVPKKKTVGYEGAHNRIRAIRGLASTYACVICAGPAREWALSADAMDIRFATIGSRKKKTAYSLDVYSYLPMCRNCHRRYDSETGNRNFKVADRSRFGDCE